MITKNRINEIKYKYSNLYFDDISEIFRLVRTTVWLYMRKTRPGIMVGLIELGFNRGNFIGGLHYSGTNEIYLNKSALRVMKEEANPDHYKAYLFFVLLHEYTHSVGFHDEALTRKVTREIIIEIFGKHHVLGKLALFGLNHYFPYTFNLRSYQPSQNEILNPEYVTLNQFESELTYI